MEITIKFSSMEEFMRYVSVDGSINSEVTHFPPAILEEAKQKMKEMAEKPVEIIREEPTEGKTEDSAPIDEEKPGVDESFRVEVRKALSALNKLQTGNPAKELIAQTGYKRLTDVPLELLPGLMEKAKEAMDHV